MSDPVRVEQPSTGRTQPAGHSQPALRGQGWSRCRTCGRYVVSSRLDAGGRCSEECGRLFACCVTCGRFFPRGGGFGQEHCSKDCATRYVMMRRYGPEPVDLVVEA